MKGTEKQIKFASDIIQSIESFEATNKYQTLAKGRILERLKSISVAKEIIENRDAFNVKNFVYKCIKEAQEWAYQEYPIFAPIKDSNFYGRAGTKFDNLCQAQRREIGKRLHAVWSEDLPIIVKQWNQNYWLAKTDEFWWGFQPMGDYHGYVQINHRKNENISGSGFPPLEALKSIARAVGADNAECEITALINQRNTYNDAEQAKFLELLQTLPII